MDFAKRINVLSVSQIGIDLPRIERAVREILLAIGEDPERDGLRDTPGRVARAYQELCAGMREDPIVHLRQVFDYEGGCSVCVKDIAFFSLCEHHLLPFFGKVSITYQPRARRVFGLSKLARLVAGFAKRLQVQERLTTQIADAVMASGIASNVTVAIEAEHLCICMRGARSADSKTVTVETRQEEQAR